MQISKSDYMLFMKHPAWLWVKKNDPSKIPPVDESTQAMFDAGHQFEPYVEGLFEGGTTLGFSSYEEYATLPSRTLQAIESGAKVLFQPRFEWQEYTCICDIVEFVSHEIVDLYEIKSSTSVKPEHLFDLAFQKAVLEGCGYKVRQVKVAYVNNKYVRKGEINARELSVIEDVTEKVKEKNAITAESMPLALKTASSQQMPNPDPALTKFGYKKEWLKIYKNLVDEPEPDFSNAQPTINHKAIKEFLSRLVFPLYFLDYETLSSLIPYFDGHRPYQQVPFQYSLHILQSPSAELTHKEYLHQINSDPARPLAEQLIKDIGTEGSVIVWFEGFEKARNTELGDMLPDLKDAMEAINSRIVDLMIPFKSKWYDDPRFNGSASIKQVLPVLCPELSYKELGIQEGGSAQRLWMEAILDGKRADEKDKILSDLVEYCGLDTLAMVEIYKRLQEV